MLGAGDAYIHETAFFLSSSTNNCMDKLATPAERRPRAAKVEPHSAPKPKNEAVDEELDSVVPTVDEQ